MNNNEINEFFDGIDWIYTWAGGAIVHHEQTADPTRFFAENIPLFTRGSLPKQNDVVLDIGAGSGGDIPAYSKMVGEHGKVIAIEADPACFRRLTKLVTLLKLENVRCYNFGVSDETTKMWLTQDRSDGLGNTLKSIALENAIEVSVRDFGDVLSSLEFSRAEYAKLNIEGSEFRALNALFRSSFEINHLCVACHNFLDDIEMHTFGNVAELLLNNGYKVSKHPVNHEAPWESWYLYADKPQI